MGRVLENSTYHQHRQNRQKCVRPRLSTVCLRSDLLLIHLVAGEGLQWHQPYNTKTSTNRNCSGDHTTIVPSWSTPLLLATLSAARLDDLMVDPVKTEKFLIPKYCPKSSCMLQSKFDLLALAESPHYGGLVAFRKSASWKEFLCLFGNANLILQASPFKLWTLHLQSSA